MCRAGMEHVKLDWQGHSGRNTQGLCNLPTLARYHVHIKTHPLQKNQTRNLRFSSKDRNIFKNYLAIRSIGNTFFKAFAI